MCYTVSVGARAALWQVQHQTGVWGAWAGGQTRTRGQCSDNNDDGDWGKLSLVFWVWHDLIVRDRAIELEIVKYGTSISAFKNPS